MIVIYYIYILDLMESRKRYRKFSLLDYISPIVNHLQYNKLPTFTKFKIISEVNEKSANFEYSYQELTLFECAKKLQNSTDTEKEKNILRESNNDKNTDNNNITGIKDKNANIEKKQSNITFKTKEKEESRVSNISNVSKSDGLLSVCSESSIKSMDVLLPIVGLKIENEVEVEIKSPRNQVSQVKQVNQDNQDNQGNQENQENQVNQDKQVNQDNQDNQDNQPKSILNRPHSLILTQHPRIKYSNSEIKEKSSEQEQTLRSDFENLKESIRSNNKSNNKSSKSNNIVTINENKELIENYDAIVNIVNNYNLNSNNSNDFRLVNSTASLKQIQNNSCELGIDCFYEEVLNNLKELSIKSSNIFYYYEILFRFV